MVPEKTGGAGLGAQTMDYRHRVLAPIRLHCSALNGSIGSANLNPVNGAPVKTRETSYNSH